MLVSVITTCKGRLTHLKQSLPRMVEQGADVEVIVVDYDCPDGAAQWVRTLYPQVRVVKVDNAPFFNAANARNRGAAAASGEWLFFVDADILLAPGMVEKIRSALRAGHYYHPVERHHSAYGTFICARQDFVLLEGYDEVLRSWGGEDRDFYYRLQHMLGRINPGFPGEWLTPIMHSDAERMRFSETKDIALNQRVNSFYLVVKYDLCRLAAQAQLPIEMRRACYDHIRNHVLTNAANGVGATRIEMDATLLMAMKMPYGWTATRKLQYEIGPIPGVSADGVARAREQDLAAVSDKAADAKAPQQPGAPRRMGHIAMFHIGRCGSTVLAEMLKQNPQIHWDSEIYEPQGELFHKYGLRADASGPIGFLRRRIASADRPHYGCEVKPYQARLVELPMGKLIESFGALGFTHFVLLERRNSLRKIVSSLIAIATQRWHVPAGTLVPLTRFRLDVNSVRTEYTDKPLLDFLRSYRDDMRDIEARLAGRPVLKLTYEDDIEADPEVAYRKVCDFLGFNPVPTAVRLGRTTPFALHDVLENYDEVAAALSGTEFEWMLEQPR